MSSAIVELISECFIKPKYEVQEAKQTYCLGPIDLALLTNHYIQKSLLFTKPSNLDDQPFSIQKFLENLKDSLSLILVHFYPLVGQLATQVDEGRHQSLIFVDCNKGPGVRFIHAMLDMTISNIVASMDVPVVVKSLFDHDRAVNHDGHYRPLLTVQVTELLDGVFIGCSMNHSIGDGTSYWHFWNMWSEIHGSKSSNRDELVPVSRMPIHKRWLLDGYGPVIHLPFTKPEEYLNPYVAPELRERIFNFSTGSISKLKVQANSESNNTSTKISSFQALSALCWRSITRAHCLTHDQLTNCKLVSNSRLRLNPPLPQDNVGNYLAVVKATTTVGELLEHNLGWAASLVHQAVINQPNSAVCDYITSWLQSPTVFKTRDLLVDPCNAHMGSSPRFDMYGNEFGLGKAVAVRSGYANKFSGKVTTYPGYEGGGSVDLEICLPPDSMTLLEAYEEFMNDVSAPVLSY